MGRFFTCAARLDDLRACTTNDDQPSYWGDDAVLCATLPSGPSADKIEVAFPFTPCDVRLPTIFLLLEGAPRWQRAKPRQFVIQVVLAYQSCKCAGGWGRDVLAAIRKNKTRVVPQQGDKVDVCFALDHN